MGVPRLSGAKRLLLQRHGQRETAPGVVESSERPRESVGGDLTAPVLPVHAQHAVGRGVQVGDLECAIGSPQTARRVPVTVSAARVGVFPAPRAPLLDPLFVLGHGLGELRLPGFELIVTKYSQGPSAGCMAASMAASLALEIGVAGSPWRFRCSTRCRSRAPPWSSRRHPRAAIHNRTGLSSPSAAACRYPDGSG